MSDQIAHDIEETPRTADVTLAENVYFKDMFFSEAILKGLKENGFKKPSPIQFKAVPLARCGFDLIVQSKSGTGKTLVFVLTTLEVVDVSIDRVQAIVLTPTREIAVQVAHVFSSVGCHIKDLSVQTFIGGMPLPNDVAALNKCHIAVGAPGRIKQLIELNHLKTEAVRLFIMDEADQLMGKSFINDINSIYWSLSEFKQVLALSATYPQELVGFLNKYLRTGRLVTPDTDPLPVLRGLSQFVSLTRSHPDSVARLLDKEKRLVSLLSSIKFNQCLVFSNYQSRAESVCNMLKGLGWSSSWISGGQHQEARLKSMETFRLGKSRILVTTDLTARGIDSKNVNLVINMDCPWDPRVYLHRMGRAGRYGSQGVVITILTEGQDLINFRKMLGLIGGDSLYVCVIPKSDEDFDLWTVDKTKFKKIYGLPPEQKIPDSAAVLKTGEDKVKKHINNKSKINGNAKEEKVVTSEFSTSDSKEFPSLGDNEQATTSNATLNEEPTEPKTENTVPRKLSYSDMLQVNLNGINQDKHETRRKRSHPDQETVEKDKGAWKINYKDQLMPKENKTETEEKSQNKKAHKKTEDSLSFDDILDSFNKFKLESSENDKKEALQKRREVRRSRSKPKSESKTEEEVFQFKGKSEEDVKGHLNKKPKVIEESRQATEVAVSPHKKNELRGRRRTRETSVKRESFSKNETPKEKIVLNIPQPEKEDSDESSEVSSSDDSSYSDTESSLSSGTYICSHSYLNSSVVHEAIESLNRSSKKSEPARPNERLQRMESEQYPFKDWYALYYQQLETIYNYVHYANHFSHTGYLNN